jgi:endothelin-converting enzyme/putative endopeptidase
VIGKLVGCIALSWLLPAPSVYAGGALKGVETGDLNRAVDPCTDFYEFANGTWRAANPIPDAKPQWSRRVAARAGNVQRVQDLLEETARRRDWPAGSAAQRAGDHYASCMDEAAADAAGLAPLAQDLAAIDGIRDRAGVQRVLRRLHALAVPVPFGVTGAPDYHQPDDFIANVVAGGLGLPGREYYASAEPRFADVREAYRAHVARVLRLGGMAEAPAREAAGGIVALETRLAAASLDAATASDPAATDHRTTFAELVQMAPHVDWAGYFDEARLPRVDLNVAEPKFVERLDKELEDTPVATWRAYLEWHLLASASPWLSRPFVDESLGFGERSLAQAATTRAQRCADSVATLFPEAVGKTYADRYFPPAAKAKAQEMTRNLLAALTETVAGAQWMAPDTKKTALEKIAATNVHLGYPDRWKDDSAVTVRRDALWANVAAGRRRNVEDDRGRIGKPTDRSVWALPPSSSAAYIDLQLNVLVLPAGFLQAPYFDAAANDAVNYGALGIGLAHDLTHAIDASGSETDVRGRPRVWWTDADRAAFEQRGRCVADQFEGYFVEPGLHHDGRRVLSESIADLAGVRVAYRALQKSMAERPVPVQDGFTPEQQFFVSWGQTTGAAMRLDAQRSLVRGDPHPVPKFRVLGPLSNVPEFQSAFSCPATAAMVRPPEERCAVW